MVAAFDAGAITSDAGALLLGATDRAIRMMDRFASCFHDVRRADLIEHGVATLVGQRVFGIALGYEDLNDHDELRHDPLMGEKKIVVGPDTVIAAVAPGNKSELKAGAHIIIFASEKQADGSLLAKVIYVGRDVTPAM